MSVAYSDTDFPIELTQLHFVWAIRYLIVSAVSRDENNRRKLDTKTRYEN